MPDVIINGPAGCHLKTKKMMRCLGFLPRPYKPLDLGSRLLFCPDMGLERGLDCGICFSETWGAGA